MVLKGQYIRASYNNREYFTLWHWKANTYKQREQATVTRNISLWEGAVVLKGQYIWAERANYSNREYFTLWYWKANTYKQATITENILLWEGAVVLKGQYIWAERASYSNKEYFTLWYWKANTYEHAKGQYIQAERANNNREYFTLWHWKANTYEQREQATVTENISLCGGCCGTERPIHTSRESKLQ